MIEIKGVHKSFGDLEVLKGIDLNVNSGEVVSIIGASGSGKSTLLYCINAIEKINSGNIIVDGVDVHNKKTDKNKLRQNLGMVFQQWNSFPHLTVLENAALAPRIVKGFTKEEADEILNFAEKRKKTLENFKKAADIYRNSNDVSEFKIVFERENGSSEFPFWNQINGPISDAIWHCGQIVLLRRSSGNPFNGNVSFFTGKVRE